MAIVADGVGGNRGGAEAAETVIATLRTLLDQPLPAAARDRHAQLLQQFYAADRQIRDHTLHNFHLRGMAATVVAAIITPTDCIHLYAGNSRLYHWRERTLAYQTADHSLVRRLVEMGTISEAETHEHSLRFAIHSCLGGWGTDHLLIDPQWEHTPHDDPTQIQDSTLGRTVSPFFH